MGVYMSSTAKVKIAVIEERVILSQLFPFKIVFNSVFCEIQISVMFIWWIVVVSISSLLWKTTLLPFVQLTVSIMMISCKFVDFVENGFVAFCRIAIIKR
jgi:hypothetical protein